MDISDIHDDSTEAFLRELRPRAVDPDFADRIAVESLLRDLAPAAPGADFADRVEIETTLRRLAPKAVSPDFASRVIRAGAAEEKSKNARVITFVRVAVPLAAAAAVALSASIFIRPDGRPDAINVASLPLAADERVNLSVVALPDGRAFRPVLKARFGEPTLRVAPGGAVFPVAEAEGELIAYEPVLFQ